MRSTLAIIAAALTISTASTAEPEIISAIINPASGNLTMVNVLTPAAGKQDEAIRLLQAGMAKEMSRQPGFISSTVHRSLNSDHVVVYAQWKDQASVDAAVVAIQSGEAPNMASVFSIASPDFHPYKVESVHQAKVDQ